MSDYPGENFDLAWREALAPSTWRNPTPKDKYHLVVIGAGPAGLIAAIGAAGLGAKVALVERHLMGGDCLNVGCVPSKALLEFTHHHPKADFASAFAWMREVRASIAPHDSVQRYTEAGVDVFLGEASFEDGRTVRVGETLLYARRIAICTGASPAVPPIPGLREAEPLTNESIFDLKMLPPTLAILGAGAIGCELAQVFARLGTRVHLFEMAPRVLPLESERASATLAQALTELGIQLHVGEAVTKVSQEAGLAIHVGEATYAVDEVLVALGRRPNTAGLALDRAGVRADPQGFIQVDKRLRTSNKRIYAAGDCSSRVQFTHHADAQARVLIQNALFAPTARADRLVVPHCTYTQPEVASVGLTAEALQAKGESFDTYSISFDELDRGRAEPFPGGYAEVFTAKGSDRILGASIVAPDAGEQIATLVMLMSQGRGLSAADRTIFAYPTRSEYLKRLAGAYGRTRLTPRVADLMRRWFRFTGD